MLPAFRNEYTGAYYHVGGDCATASNKSTTTPKKGRLIFDPKRVFDLAPPAAPGTKPAPVSIAALMAIVTTRNTVFIISLPPLK